MQQVPDQINIVFTVSHHVITVSIAVRRGPAAAHIIMHVIHALESISLFKLCPVYGAYPLKLSVECEINP